MKVLEVAMGMGIGGAETHILELSKSLKESGIDVDIISNGGVLEASLEENNIKNIKAPLHSRNPFSILKSYSILKKCIKENNYDIVNSHARIPSYLCYLLSKKHNFRFVTTTHFDFKVNGLLKRLSHWGEYTFSISQDLNEYLLKEYGFDRSRIIDIVNGIDRKIFNEIKVDNVYKTKLGIDKKVVLHISRLDQNSSVCAENLINIASEFCRNNTCLIIIGNGSEYDRLCALADKVNAQTGEKIIYLLGAVYPVDDYIKSADLFVGPSRAALEAISCGKTTIISGSEGHIGLFNEGTKTICEKTNFCGRNHMSPSKELLLKDIVEALKFDENKKAEIAEYNVSYIEKNYSTFVMSSKYIDTYRRIEKYKKYADKYDVVISGYYGYGNMGDEIVLSQIINNLRSRKPDISICVLCSSTSKISEKYGVKAINRFDLIKVKKAIANSKLLLFGGGNLLQDSTSRNSLLYYLRILKYGVNSKCKVAIFSNGIGPIKRKSSSKSILDIFNKVDYISLRENDSYEMVINSINDKSKVFLTSDPVFNIDYDNKEKREEYIVCFPRNNSASQIMAMTYTTKKISEKYGYKVLLIPMQYKEDIKACEMMKKMILGSEILKNNMDAMKIIEIASKSKFVLCSRLHSAILSYISNTPFYAFSNDDKIKSFIDTTNIKKEIGFIPYFSVDFDINEIMPNVERMLNTSINFDGRREELKTNSKNDFDRLIRII